MPAHPPEKRDEVLTLIRDGVPRNEIARRTGVAAGLISKWAKDAGLSFDRAATEHATKARQADLAARRANLRDKFLTRADELLDMFDKPVTVFNFGGRDNTYEERQLDRPTISDLRSLVQAAATASTQEIRIAQADAGHGDEAAKSLLVGLANAFGITGPDPEPSADDDA